MELNKIKKLLYKQKPKAIKLHEDAEKNSHYLANLKDGSKDGYRIKFFIPHNENDGFKNEEPAQLLIRWIKL